MKSRFLRVLILGLFIVFLLAACSNGNVTDITTNNGSSTDGNKDSNYVNSFNGFKQVAESQKFILMANMNEGQIALKSKDSNYIWYSSPQGVRSDKSTIGINKMKALSQLIVASASPVDNQIALATSYTASVSMSGLKLENIPNGVKFIYDFPGDTEKFKISVLFTLVNDCLKVEIPTSEIREYGDRKIVSISLLPFFGAGGAKDKGYMMVPDGSGALINFNNGKSNYDHYSQDIYGRDTTLAKVYENTVLQSANLPVYGIKSGNEAFLAVVNKGDFLGKIEAYVGGKNTSYNNAYCTFRYRETDSLTLTAADWTAKTVPLMTDKPNSAKSFEVLFYPLEGKNADYSGMANRYRKFLIDEKGMKKTEYKKDLPFFFELYGSIKKQKSILGIPLTTIQPLTTYSQSIDILKQIKNAGINNIVLKYTDWMKGGANDKIPTNVQSESKLGGSSGFRELVKYSKENNIELFPDADLLNFYKSGNGFYKSFDATKTLTRTPAEQFSYRLSTGAKNDNMPSWYQLSPLLLGKAVDGFCRSYKQYDISNVSLGTMGSLVYSDYKTGKEVSREVSGGIVQKELGIINQNVGKLLVEDANAYAFPYVSDIVNVPSGPSCFDIEDKEIPFYQMVVHGMIQYSSPPINLSNDITKETLKAVETGSSPYYAWIAGGSSELKETNFDYLYSANYRIWLENAINDYKRINQSLSGISDKIMVSHKKLQDGVYETQYENNVNVIVNYNKEDFKIDGKVVSGENYLVFEGGN